MKKLILTCFICMPLLCGCVASVLEAQDISEFIVCVDGIEYIKYTAGYSGYMAPHLKADKNDNPRVIKCRR